MLENSCQLPGKHREGEALVRDKGQRVTRDVPHEVRVTVVTEQLQFVEQITPVVREQEEILLPRLDADGSLEVDGTDPKALESLAATNTGEGLVVQVHVIFDCAPDFEHPEQRIHGADADNDVEVTIHGHGVATGDRTEELEALHALAVAKDVVGETRSPAAHEDLVTRTAVVDEVGGDHACLSSVILRSMVGYKNTMFLAFISNHSLSS